MDLVVLDEKETPFALRGLRDVVASNGTITPAERRFIEVIAELHGAKVDVGSLRSIEPKEVAEAVTEPHKRKRVVQLAVIAAMVEGDVTSAGAAAVRKLARALEVDEASLKVLKDLASHHRLLTRFDVVRRKGTLGRAFWVHSTKNRFGFPGEKGGIPERMVYHDFGHVLAGYDTTPAGEIQQGAFQAGFTREDGFVFLMFAIIQFHLGVTVQPAAENTTGLFDVAKVLRAAGRGAACSVDLSDRWDPFAVTGLSLEQVRAEYGIPPL